MGVIYVRPNLINGKKYVGQATDLKERQRKWNDLNQPYAGPAINNARAKYGIEAFGFEILKECDDKELDYWEKYYVKELNTKAPYGYNLTDGGGGMSGYTHSAETRKKISKGHKGKEPWKKGKHHSYETRKKISEAHRGKYNKNKKSKPVLQMDKTNKIIAEFSSTMEVKRQLGISQSHISMCCNGKRKTAGGYKWQYK